MSLNPLGDPTSILFFLCPIHHFLHCTQVLYMCAHVCECVCMCCMCMCQGAGLSCFYGHAVSQAGDVFFKKIQVVPPHWNLAVLAPTAPLTDCSRHAALLPPSRKSSSVSVCSECCGLRLPDPGFLLRLIETQGHASTIIIGENSSGI